jgi:N-acetylneuraminic acid mutarotase
MSKRAEVLSIVVICASAAQAACGSGGSGAATGEAEVAENAVAWSGAAPLPVPTSNNAVAAVQVDGADLVFSFLGLDSTRVYSGIHDRSFRYDVARDEWTEIAGPGVGRIAGTAQAVGAKIYLFGGYTVAADGSEKSTPDVDIYDPAHGSWSSGAPMPVPVDDAVSGVWRDSLIFLISGWHDTDNVPDVQIYDPFNDSWAAATSIPGPRVFGHAGAIAGNTIVYVDGVRRMPTRPRYQITAAAYRGEINPSDPTNIVWRAIPPHPGPPLYRMASAAFGARVIFAGGSANPYNYDGMGYDGRPSEPSSAVFSFNVESEEWETLPAKPLASMDHRGFAVAGRSIYIIGGMIGDQRVTRRVQVGDLSGSNLE